MKISIITVVYNGEKYLIECINSILSQDYKNIEYIVIDGGSTDGTLAIIEDYKSQIQYFISEKDNGMYDALNKGIKVATGDIIGILNSDDMLASNNVISSIVNEFQKSNVDGVYGNLNYIDLHSTYRIVRKWVSKQFFKKDILFGWMPAHPTIYLKKELFKNFGYYSLDYGTAGDYELIIRFFYVNKINAKFLDKLFVNMRVGGMSNVSIKQRYLALLNDYKAVKNNGLPFPFFTIIFKKLRKIKQFAI